MSLELPSSGLVSIKGASGSGKSTFLNLLSNMDKPSEGSIIFQDKDLSSLSKKEEEDYHNFDCGFIYQHFNLLEEYDAIFNVTLPLLIRGVSKKKARLKAGILFKEFGIESLMNKKCGLLSGGEKQRVAILRAIITEPKTIFADEPTGALDEQNERLVMELLKKLSRSRLVVLVSHNERIVREYSDRIIELENGEVKGDTGGFCKEKGAKSLYKRGQDKSWVSSLLKHRYKKDALKNSLSLVSSFLGFLAIILSIGFYEGSKICADEEGKKSLSYLSLRLSSKKSYELEGTPLSLVQEKRPELEVAERRLSSIPKKRLAIDYSYIFPSRMGYSLNGIEQEEATFVALDDVSLSNRKTAFSYEGSLPERGSIDEVLVNKEFAALFPFSLLGMEIKLASSNSFSFSDYFDEAHFSFSFIIAAVVEEFSFLSTPKIFYPYEAIDDYFMDYELKEISRGKNEETTVSSFIASSDDGSAYSSYGYLLFLGSENEVKPAKELISELEKNEDELTLASDSFLVEESFLSLTSAFFESLMPFLFIAILGVSFIVAFLAYSSFLERKKEAAILWALGSDRKSSMALHLLPSVITSFLAALLSLTASSPVSKAFSKIISSKVGMDNLIKIPYLKMFGIPFLLPLGIIVFSLLIAFIGAYVPYRSVKNKNLSEELKDE
ncbi:MAG: ABC transporter ATP-binding protein/permease [Bacilli bacterium]|nr:ABC transporter ATP-binding protein/permease [Bacilli bacterium]MCH4228577.1 ABC transporter ATP-binding protein/permease [Bacilli bacterium]MCH4277895.1 ABC transporter ATP-binding protein/permease [Bacilli bacterium]MCI2055253.1 ABC transporter ATP-binding protein/permease [Bacilli bacterium]